MRFIFCFFVLLASALPVAADVADYCAAFARDNADLGERQTPKWQKRYDNALQSCTEQFPISNISKPAQTVEKSIKPVAKNVKAKPQPVPKAKPKVVTPAPKSPETSAQVVALKLEEGSQEWVKYCKSKYVSFNQDTGNYLSKTGVERKCLVTAD